MELARERKSLAELVEKPTATASEIGAAQAKVNAMEQRCFRMTLEHIYTSSESMEVEKGARYRKHLRQWENNGWRIDTDALDRLGDERACAIPSPARRDGGRWVLPTVPLLGGV